MAFSNNPAYNTYSQHPVSAVVPLDLRSEFDSSPAFRVSPGMLNFHPVPSTDGPSKDLIAVSRKQIIAGTVNTIASNFHAIRGIYVWEKSIGTVYYFLVDNTKVYTSTTGYPGSWTVILTLATAAFTPVGFTEYIDATNVKSLILVDGIEGWVFTSNAVGTKIVDADFPTPHIPFPIFIDGYLFLAKKGTGDIYNSDLNLPASWTAGNFISSEMYPDDLQALVKVSNYMVAIGTQASEFFYDAGNPTGSPLAREEGSSLPFGTTLPGTIACNKNTVMFLANNNDGTAVFKVIEDKRNKEIHSAWWLVPFLSEYLATSGNVAGDFRGYFIRHGSDLSYCFKNSIGLGCFVYSTTADMWTEYSSSIDANGFPVDCTAFSTSDSLVTFVGGKYSSSIVFFGTLGYSKFSVGFTTAPFTNTGLDYFNGDIAVPFNIPFSIRLPSLDFSTLNKKTMSRMGVVLEKMNASTNPETIDLTVSWSDTDDYTNVLPSAVLHATGTLSYPFITQLGVFNQRRFFINYSGNIGIRVKRFEFNINKGSL